MHSVEMYEENANDATLEQFVLEHQPLVKKLALYIKHRLPSHVALEDLLQSGFVGLLEARKISRMTWVQVSKLLPVFAFAVLL